MRSADATASWGRWSALPPTVTFIALGMFLSPHLSMVWILLFSLGVALLIGLYPRFERLQSEEHALEWHAVRFDFRWAFFSLIPVVTSAFQSSNSALMLIMCTAFMLAVNLIGMMVPLSCVRICRMRLHSNRFRFVFFTGFHESEIQLRPSGSGRDIVLELGPGGSSRSYRLEDSPAKDPLVWIRTGKRFPGALMWGKAPAVEALQKRVRLTSIDEFIDEETREHGAERVMVSRNAFWIGLLEFLVLAAVFAVVAIAGLGMVWASILLAVLSIMMGFYPRTEQFRARKPEFEWSAVRLDFQFVLLSLIPVSLWFLGQAGNRSQALPLIVCIGIALSLFPVLTFLLYAKIPFVIRTCSVLAYGQYYRFFLLTSAYESRIDPLVLPNPDELVLAFGPKRFSRGFCLTEGMHGGRIHRLRSRRYNLSIWFIGRFPDIEFHEARDEETEKASLDT